MKLCPRCGKSYSDDGLNFCLDDGELLAFSSGTGSRPFKDDSPPTIVLDSPRVTNPIGWEASHPIEPWQGRSAMQGQHSYPMQGSASQSLALVSLCLGLASITIGWCCSTGLLLAPAALITGIIALVQINKDPAHYGGRGLAIGGVITGALYVAGYVLLMLIYGIAMIGGGLG